MKIVIASKNPVKVNAVTAAFSRVFTNVAHTVESVSVASGVPDQPMSDLETYTGAKNRVDNASSAVPDADYWVGIEGGIHMDGADMQAFAWAVVKSRGGTYGKARTSTFILPPQVAELVLGGMELGHADDVVFGRSNSKQENGAVGLLTRDMISRTSYYTEALTLALIPFINPEHYP
jgi:inosine/xanthosine triphosphatase